MCRNGDLRRCSANARVSTCSRLGRGRGLACHADSRGSFALDIPTLVLHQEWAHPGVGNTRLRRFGEMEPSAEIAEGAIVCRQRLGGLLKLYYRQAA